MSQSDTYYRVKVRVDGNWVFTGDFYLLEQARERARLIGFQLGREVRIWDSKGRLIQREQSALAGDGRDAVEFEESSSRDTLILD